MKTKDFDFYLPKEQIAQKPLEKRDESKLMVLDKKTGEIKHKIFKNIIDYLNDGDVLVLNNTRVIPARLMGQKVNTGGKIEFLLLKRLEKDKWEILTKPGRKAKVGAEFVFGDKLFAKIVEVKEDGNRVAEFSYDGVFEEILDELGNMPLPPYITEKLNDKERYQTVYSKHNGSAAAPTAGLHFTKELMHKIKKKGVKLAYVTLHVGLGTFRPVQVDDVLNHKMHSEYFDVPKVTCDIINEARANNKKIISVGTTSCRTLESCNLNENKELIESSGYTEIFIYPGYEFKVIDNLITNFHLPESTLLMLVSALSTKDNILNAYKIAVEENYRFFSFGDAMILLDL